MFKGKISVIGAGFVGSTTAYTLMLSGLASEIVLIDIDNEKAEGDAMDMNHGVSFVSPVKIEGSSNYSLISGSKIVIITAGANQKPNESRVDLLKRNTNIFKNIINDITKYCSDETIIVVVTNPVDILTYITYKLSGFKKQKVIGSGTVLDTARLKYLIGQETNVDSRNVHTYVVGEHGDSEVAVWSTTSIAGVNIEDYCEVCKSCNERKINKEELYHKTKNAAYEIIQKKGATYYAVALSVKRIVEAIIGNENSILTVSSVLDNEYGISDVSLSLPTILNQNGIRRILEVPFSDTELINLKKSSQALKGLIKEIGF